MPELRPFPCRKCGSDPVLVREWKNWWFVTCPPCGPKEGAGVLWYDKRGAIEAWNDRFGQRP